MLYIIRKKIRRDFGYNEMMMDFLFNAIKMVEKKKEWIWRTVNAKKK